MARHPILEELLDESDDPWDVEPPEPPPDPFAGLTPCATCLGTGMRDKPETGWASQAGFCATCEGIGYLDIPTGPVSACPGSLFKIAVLSKRYVDGLPLFDPNDRSGHG